jgi:hypothetical protein
MINSLHHNEVLEGKNQFMCTAPGMTENPYNDRQTKRRLRCLEGKVNGGNPSTANDIFEIRSIAECSSKVKLHLPFFALALSCKRIIRLCT